MDSLLGMATEGGLLWSYRTYRRADRLLVCTLCLVTALSENQALPLLQGDTVVPSQTVKLSHEASKSGTTSARADDFRRN